MTDLENPLDGCLHVFIDLGANRGLQIRKLYEPTHFPLSPVLKLFDRFFGKPDNRKLQEICSVRLLQNHFMISSSKHFFTRLLSNQTQNMPTIFTVYLRHMHRVASTF